MESDQTLCKHMMGARLWGADYQGTAMVDVSFWPHKWEGGRKTQHHSQRGEHSWGRAELTGRALGLSSHQASCWVSLSPAAHGWPLEKALSSEEDFHSFPRAKQERGGHGGREAGNLPETLS